MAARTLFEADALNTVIRVVNLSDQSYKLHQDQLFSEAVQVEVCGCDSSQARVVERPQLISAHKSAIRHAILPTNSEPAQGGLEMSNASLMSYVASSRVSSMSKVLSSFVMM